MMTFLIKKGRYIRNTLPVDLQGAKNFYKLHLSKRSWQVLRNSENSKINILEKILKIFKYLALFLAAAIITGCASNPQLPVPITSTKTNAIKSVAIVSTGIPVPGLNYPGASCLLCLGAAAAGNSSLQAYAKTLSADDLKSFTTDAKDVLIEKNIEAKVVSDSFSLKNLSKYPAQKLPNFAKKDFTKLKAEFGTSHVLVINMTYAGMTRNYNSYVATSAPYANVSGLMYLVDLETNSYAWYQPIQQHIFADGEWKQPKEFPNLTNSYYEAIESAREVLLSNLSKL